MVPPNGLKWTHLAIEWHPSGHPHKFVELPGERLSQDNRALNLGLVCSTMALTESGAGVKSLGPV